MGKNSRYCSCSRQLPTRRTADSMPEIKKNQKKPMEESKKVTKTLKDKKQKKVKESRRDMKKNEKADKKMDVSGRKKKSIRGKSKEKTGSATTGSKDKESNEKTIPQLSAPLRKETVVVEKKMDEPEQEMVNDNEIKEGELRPMPSYLISTSLDTKLNYERFARRIFSLGVEGLLKEYMEQLKPYLGQPFARKTFDEPENTTKNRYKDVICNDYTRVILADNKGSDYIHANYVKGDPLFNEFICTQGPMKTTQEDFWRMILHLKIRHIIMLCEIVELGKVKCEQYWPLQLNEKLTFGEISIEHVSQNTKDSQVTSTLLQVTRGTETHRVRHHQWKTWPDRSIPKSTRAALRILRWTRDSAQPITVHCSAGVGRTGTLVALEMCLQRLLSNGKVDLIAICKRLRDQRMHVLQVDIQYVYLAQAILEYGRTINLLESPELIEELAKFKSSLETVVAYRDAFGQPLPQKANNEKPAGSNEV